MSLVFLVSINLLAKIFEDKTPVKFLGLYKKSGTEFIEIDKTTIDVNNEYSLVGSYAKVLCADGDMKFIQLDGMGGSIGEGAVECYGTVNFTYKTATIYIMNIIYVYRFLKLIKKLLISNSSILTYLKVG